MTKDARQQMVAAAAAMIGARGVVPTSMRELAKAGGPLGSIYHYFPGGKEQVIEEATELIGRRVEKFLLPAAEHGAVAVLDAFVGHWRDLLVSSDFQAGCAVLAVATDGTGQVPAATEAAVAIFRRWQAMVADALIREGAEAERAQALAWLVLSSLEGALALARSCRTLEPIDRTAAELRALVTSATTVGSGAPARA